MPELRSHLLIGLGAFGDAVLQSIQRQMPDQDIKSIALGFEPSNAARITISLRHDVTDFLTRYAQSDFLNWFKGSAHDADQTERQWARLAWFSHLNQQQSLITALQSSLSTSPDVIILIASLQDSESAFLPDLALVIRRVAAVLDFGPRIRTFLVLDTNRPALTFAALREMRRLSHGSSMQPQPINYGPDNGTNILTGSADKLFDGLYLYTHSVLAGAKQSVADTTPVANTVLAYLDPVIGRVLSASDENLTESTAALNLQASRQGLPMSYYVGLRQAQVLQLPRGAAQDNLIPRLMHVLVDRWLGTDQSVADSLLKKWAAGELYHPQYRLPIQMPSILAEAVQHQLAPQFSGSFETLQDRVADLDGIDLLHFYLPESDIIPDDDPLAQSYARLTNERPRQTAVQRLTSPREVHQQVTRLLKTLFGESPAEVGEFAIHLTNFRTWYRQQFERSLIMLLDLVLNDWDAGGLRVARPIISRLKDLTKQLASQMQLAVQQATVVYDFHEILSVDLLAVQRLTRRVFGGLTLEFELYLEHTDRLWDEHVKRQVLIVLAAQLSDLEARLQQCEMLLRQWETVLLKDERSLHQQLKQTVQASVLPLSPNWLMNAEWLEQQYQRMLALLLEITPLGDYPARHHLRWNIEIDGAGAVQINALLGQTHLDNTRVDWASTNFRTALQLGHQLTMPVVSKWTIWDYWLNPLADNPKPAAIVEMLLSPPPVLSVSAARSQKHSRFFVHPSAEKLLPDGQQKLEAIKDLIRQRESHFGSMAPSVEIHQSSFDDRFMHLISMDVIALQELTHLKSWEKAYQNEADSALYHVFEAEQIAVQFEKHMVLPDQRLLSDPVTGLLCYYEYLPLYVWVEATNILGEMIVYPENAMFFERATRFFDRLANGTLDVDDITQRIDDRIDYEVTLWKAEQEPAPQTEVWQWAKALEKSRSGDQAQHEAFAHDVIDSFIARLNHKRDTQIRPEQYVEYDFIQVILLCASREREQKHHLVRNLLN